LPCPISAFGGALDREIDEADVLAWQQQTRGDFRARRFDGDHFFLQSCQAEVIAAIAEDLGGT
jgi:surfactin synthase thioesterase subunit